MDELCFAYYPSNPDSVLLYARTNLVLSKQVNDDTVYMHAANFMGDVLSNSAELEKAIDYYELALKTAQKLHARAKQVRAIVYICQNYMSLGRYAQAINRLNTEALPVALAANDKRSEAEIYDVLSGCYDALERYDRALDYAMRSLAIKDAVKDNTEAVFTYTVIATIYSKQKNYNQALNYALRADSLFTVLKYESSKTPNNLLIGIIYKNMGRYDDAIKIYNKTLVIAQTVEQQAAIRANLAIALSLKGAFTGAREHILYSIRLNDDVIHNIRFSVGLNADAATIYFRKGYLDSAIYYAKRSEEFSSKLEKGASANEYRENLSLLAQAYAKKGDTGNAYRYSLKFIAAQDSAYNEQRIKSIAAAESRLGLSEKDKTISEISLENEVQKIKVQRQSIVTATSVVGLLLGIILASGLVVAYRRSQRRNKQLSEQKALIDRQVQALAEAADMKSKFFANLSHELRTPVTLLTGMLGLMKRDDEPQSKKKDHINIAYDSSLKLQKMVEEILDITRLENKATSADLRVEEIQPLIKRIIYAFETLMENEGLSFHYEDGGTGGLFIKTDESKLTKILNNLVYNAIKFTPAGGIIKVSVLQDHDRVAIAVSDNGIGISSHDLPHVFERYYQGDPGRNSGGIGIGLSLVSEFTELMGGTISITSEEGQGSTFLLHFPMIAPEQDDIKENKSLLTLPEQNWNVFAHKQKVLLVEDNTEMRYYLKEILADKVSIAEAGNGTEALQWLGTNIPDLVITDMMMPQMNGKELVAQMKQSATLKKIPVITLTALADTDYQLNILRMGVDDYIVKPFNADELSIRVYNLLCNQMERRQSVMEPAEAEDVIADTREADEFKMKINRYVLSRLNNFEISVDDMAVELGLSRRQLYRFSKQVTGYTPAQLIKEVKLQKAFELLVSGTVYKLDDVARQVGFDHTSYFSKQFFERFGKRPSEFL